MKQIPVFIQLTHPSDPALQNKLKWFLAQPGCSFQVDKNAELPVLHVTRNGIFLDDGEERLTFHPSMSLIRILQGNRGEDDRFLSATGLESGQTFLDATLGLGTDALVAAWKVGEKGRVIAVEHSPLIAALIKEGLEALRNKELPHIKNPEKQVAWRELITASQNIEVKWGDHFEILSNLPDLSVDVVYFDPMFRRTREKSASIRPLHAWSDNRPLRLETIREACRVARSRVVLKERKGSLEFARLGFHVFNSGRYSQVDYGIIDCSSTEEGKS